MVTEDHVKRAVGIFLELLYPMTSFEEFCGRKLQEQFAQFRLEA